MRIALFLRLRLGATPAAGRQADPSFNGLAAQTTARLREYLRIRTVNPPGHET